MKVLIAALALLVPGPAAAQECQMCSSADACIQTYLKSVSQAQREIKQAVREWRQSLDTKASRELFNKGAAALQVTMESQVRSELERLKQCLAKIK
jgi:DNA polymerase I-like protein with 3'-5' exonuclease and polymerase domains